MEKMIATLKSKNLLAFPLFIAFFIEIALLTFLRNSLNAFLSPLVLFLASIFIAIYPLFMDNESEDLSVEYSFPSLLSNKIIWIIYLVGLLLLFFEFQSIIKVFNDPMKSSDVIPHAEILAKRFLNGEQPYKPIHDFGYEFYPSYMPLHWLPLTISLSLNIDPRWMNFLMLAIGIFLYEWFIMSTKKVETTFMSCMKASLPFLIIKLFLISDKFIFAVTLESIIASFYMILCFCLFCKSAILRGVGLAAGILSRYSLIFWTPVYLIILYFTEKKFKTFTIFFSSILIILGLYVIPFLLKDYNIFLKGLGNYSNGILSEWIRQGWQNPGDRPYHLFRGIGFASYFYTFISGDIPHKIYIAKLSLIAISVISSVFYLVLFIKVKSKFKENKMISLLALKFVCSVFFSFILVPYNYLFLTSILISVFIVGGIYSGFKIPYLDSNNKILSLIKRTKLNTR